MISVEPTKNDVLCGRGMHHFKHPGNQSLHGLIVLYIDKYLQCERKRDKTTIVRTVMKAIFNDGRRFLKYDSSSKSWYDGGLATAKTRVGVAFRDAKVPNKVRYVKDMKAALANLEREPPKTKPKLRPSSKAPSPARVVKPTRPSSSDFQLILPQMVLPDFPSSESQIQTPSPISTRMDQAPSIVDHTNIAFFESIPLVSDNESLGDSTADHMLEDLSTVGDLDDDESSCSHQWEEESVNSCCDSQEEIALTQNEHSNELHDFINSNEMFLDDFVVTLASNGVHWASQDPFLAVPLSKPDVMESAFKPTTMGVHPVDRYCELALRPLAVADSSTP